MKGYILVLCFLVWSCESFVEIEPPQTSLIGNTVFLSDSDVTAAMVGIYSKMVESSANFASGTQSITSLTGLSSDEFKNHSNNIHQVEYLANELTVTNSFVKASWSELYRYIYSTNAILEGLNNSENISESVKRQIEGEAKFVQAFCYFYLVNLFGDIPVVTSTDFELNSKLSRVSEKEVYDHIIESLLEARDLLEQNYVNNERIRPNKSTATALLARVFLYLEDWANAEAQATLLIDDGNYVLEEDINNVFLIQSREAIWQLQAIVEPFNTFDAEAFIIRFGAFHVSLSEELLGAFESGDNRFVNWIGDFNDGSNFYPYKYKAGVTETPVEYLIVFRLAEQYLIRAEARAQQNNLVGAQDDLNAIRNRSGLLNTNVGDQASLLLAIEQERRIEFFAEWGHRWLDLKRSNRSDAILGTKTGWQSTDVLYPIPQEEIQNNPNLTPQNPGYF